MNRNQNGAADSPADKKLVNGKGGNENLTPKQKRAFVKMLSKFIRLVDAEWAPEIDLKKMNSIKYPSESKDTV